MVSYNFADMRENVINARFGIKQMDPQEDFGHNDGLQVVLNKHGNVSYMVIKINEDITR